jgi:hypothetical protein
MDQFTEEEHMNRESIYLAGWLTTAVVAAVAILGLANGSFGVGSEQELGLQAIAIPTAEAQIPTIQATFPTLAESVNPDGVLSKTDRSDGRVERSENDSQSTSLETVDDSASPSRIIEYVYPDGSPAPAPSAPKILMERDHDDDDDDYYNHDEDDHDDDHDDGLEGLRRWVFERDDD